MNSFSISLTHGLATCLPICLVLCLTINQAQAASGLAVLPATSTKAKSVKRGPFTFALAVEAPARRGNGRLVVISRGSGGSAWVHVDLAQAPVDGGFIVAVPRHRGDNYKDASNISPTL